VVVVTVAVTFLSRTNEYARCGDGPGDDGDGDGMTGTRAGKVALQHVGMMLWDGDKAKQFFRSS
jgi:hypothetical protein